MRDPQQLSPLGSIENKIFYVRGRRVMFDCDLAELYRVETHELRQTVQRNRSRFPADFMFTITGTDCIDLKSQPASRLSETMSVRSTPMVFTGLGVAMLSTVINSERAVEVNIQIIRSSGNLRQMISANADLAKRLKTLARKHDSQFRDVFAAIHALMDTPEQPKHKNKFTPREKKLAHEMWVMG